MRHVILAAWALLAFGCASSSDEDLLKPRTGLSSIAPGKLEIEIHSPEPDVYATGSQMMVDVEGAASTIGGVRFLDMMLVLDTSKSLRRTDPDDYRTAGAVGLVRSLPSRSNVQIGVVGFDDDSELTQPLTTNRDEVVAELEHLKRFGGTNVAEGMLTALAELHANGRPGSSRVIMLFTDGKSNRSKARDATRLAQELGVTVQTVQLGDNEKGAAMLHEIAVATGGSFVQVRDPSELPEAFLNLRTTGVDRVTLSVNGSAPVPAHLAGGTFARRLPLQLGENRIVARATSLDEQTGESILTVNVHDASCATLEVAAIQDGRPSLSINERAVQIVVDASRSMWGRMDGQPKMTIAKDILRDASSWLPGDLALALRAYGNTSPSDDRDCADSALLVPFGADNRDAIRRAVGGLKPRGQTPIAFALKQAAGDFASLQSERTIILVTDGIESCGGDPVAAARELRAQGITIHLIGFGLDNAADEDTASLMAIAEASGGEFLTAGSAAELKQALEDSVGTRFSVTLDDTVVARGALGSQKPVYLPTGSYRLRLDSVPPRDVAVTLGPREQLTLTLNRHDGVVTHSEQRSQLEPTSCEAALAAQRARSEDAVTVATAADPSGATRSGYGGTAAFEARED